MSKPLTPKPQIDEVVTSPSAPLRTTLYDLIAAMQDVAESPEDLQAVTAAATHVLNTRRVICEGRFKGARLVGDAQPICGGERGSAPQFDKIAVSF
jgi:hypothetical protein